MVELHGNIMQARCAGSCPPPPGGAGGPGDRCTACGGPLRPAVVWFGEPLPPGALEEAFAAAAACDLCLSVGTSALVQPAASIAPAAREAGALLAEINLEPTPLTDTADLFLQGRSGEILPRLLAALERPPD